MGLSSAICAQTRCAKFLATGQRTAFLPSVSGVTTCRPLPPVVLQKHIKTDAFRADRECPRRAAITASNVTSGAGSKSNTRRPGGFRIVAGAIPGMQFQRADLRHGSQGLEPIDLHIRGLVAAHLHEVEQVGHARHRVPLKELLVPRCRRVLEPASRVGPARCGSIHSPDCS